MRMQQALVSGYFCGMATDSECVMNIHHHCMSIFRYEDIVQQLEELDASFIEFQELTPQERTDVRLSAKREAMALERQAHLEWQRKTN